MSISMQTNPRSPRLAFAEQVLLGLLIAAALLLFVTQGYCVSGTCMEPHLYTGERILTYKLAYAWHGPRRGDIIVFLYPRDTHQIFVKRVIGLPGDTISIRAGQVYIDNKPLSEPYRVNPAHGNMAAQFVPRGEYFVMGDNRDFSDDSRFWGDLPRQDIIGRALACYWPPVRSHLLR